MFGRATITLGIDPHSSCFGAADWVTGRVNINTCATYPSKSSSSTHGRRQLRVNWLTRSHVENVR